MLSAWTNNILVFVCLSEALLILLLCSAGSGLELSPSMKEIILTANSSISITCSGWAPVSWRYKRDEKVPVFRTENRSLTSSILHLENVTWNHTGVYVCSENGSEEFREMPVYVPGEKHIICTYSGDTQTILQKLYSLHHPTHCPIQSSPQSKILCIF